MTRIRTLLSASLVLGILFLSAPYLSYGQRRGSARRGTSAGVGNGNGLGGANGSGIGGTGPTRRTAVIVAGARNGVIGDGGFGNGGFGGNLAHPGLAAIALSRRVPIGTVVEILPSGCEMAFILEVEYYYCAGQYYQPMGAPTAPIYVAAEPYIPD